MISDSFSFPEKTKPIVQTAIINSKPGTKSSSLVILIVDSLLLK